MPKVLCMRTCKSDLTSFGGFQWPESGPVSTSDWDAKPECGNGLHGLLWGEGQEGYLKYTFERWVNFIEGRPVGIFESRFTADTFAHPDRTACIHVYHEFEDGEGL